MLYSFCSDASNLAYCFGLTEAVYRWEGQAKLNHSFALCLGAFACELLIEHGFNPVIISVGLAARLSLFRSVPSHGGVVVGLCPKELEKRVHLGLSGFNRVLLSQHDGKQVTFTQVEFTPFDVGHILRKPP